MQAEKLIQKKLAEGLSGHAWLFISETGKIVEDQIEKISTSLQIPKTGTIEIFPEDKKNGEITIGIMRDLRRQLSRIAVNGHRLVVIREADKINTEAANSFLKTLEEPPDRTVILLLSKTANLLPTIVSRCQTYIFPSVVQVLDDNVKINIDRISKLSIKEKFAEADKIAKSGQALEFVDQLISFYRYKFLEDKNYKELVNDLVTARVHLAANVSPRLVLENIFMRLS